MSLCVYVGVGHCVCGCVSDDPNVVVAAASVRRSFSLHVQVCLSLCMCLSVYVGVTVFRCVCGCVSDDPNVDVAAASVRRSFSLHIQVCVSLCVSMYAVCVTVWRVCGCQ